MNPQSTAILRRLERGDTLTPLDALNDPGIRSMRLAARLWELRANGNDIETIPVVLEGGKRVAGYRLRVRVDPGGQRLLA